MTDESFDTLTVPEVSAPVKIAAHAPIKCPVEDCNNELRSAPMHIGGRGTVSMKYCDAGHTFTPQELAEEWGWEWESGRVVPPSGYSPLWDAEAPSAS